MKYNYLKNHFVMWTKHCLLFSLIIFSFTACIKKKSNSRIEKFRNKNLSETIGDYTPNMPIDTNAKPLEISIPKDLDKSFKLSDVIESVTYLKLGEVPNDILTGLIRKLTIKNGKIFILDGHKSDVFVFDDLGNFEFAVRGSGDGPGEFRKASAFAVDSFNEEIAIHDDKLSKIVYYKLNGDFIREEFIGFRFSDFEFLNDSTIAVETAKTYNDHLPDIKNNQLILVNKQWKIISKGIDYNANTERKTFFSGQALRFYGENLSYFKPFSNTQYEISKSGNLVPIVKFEMNQLSLPEQAESASDIDEFHNLYFKKDYAFLISSPIHLKDWIYALIEYNNRQISIFYDKNSTESIYGLNYENDIQALGFYYIETLIPDSNQLVSYISSESIAKAKENLPVDTSSIPEDIAKLFSKTVAEDNPVLIFYNLKSN
ncbi:6-bladed beta-propeller [Belliella pelovolcani]|uniref:6-bladed beta-propeller n=1 Tax=Belliella pelovolcani TaxID=529505 RepID=UPI00391C3960